MFRRLHFTFVLMIAASSLMFADQVVLKNGDRLTGTVVKSDGKTLVIKTEFAGDVTIQWPAVQQITAEQQLHVGLANGQTLVGPVSPSDGKLAVNTKAGTVAVETESVAVIRNDAEQAAYEKSRNPGWLEGWNGGANVGFALTGGNSQTENLALAFNAARTTQADKLSLYANSVYTHNNAPGAVPSTVANLVQGGIRYDYNLSKRTFAFVGADFMSDALQDLNLRSVGTLGLGFHAIKSDNTTLDLLAGGDYTHESYTTFNRNSGGVTLGEEFMHKLHGRTVINESLYFFPDLTDRGEYRGTFNFGTVTKISKWFGWQNSFGDIYVTNPPVGKKKNDVIFTTGLNVSFTH